MPATTRLPRFLTLPFLALVMGILTLPFADQVRAEELPLPRILEPKIRLPGTLTLEGLQEDQLDQRTYANTEERLTLGIRGNSVAWVFTWYDFEPVFSGRYTVRDGRAFLLRDDREAEQLVPDGRGGWTIHFRGRPAPTHFVPESEGTVALYAAYRAQRQRDRQWRVRTQPQESRAVPVIETEDDARLLTLSRMPPLDDAALLRALRPDMPRELSPAARRDVQALLGAAKTRIEDLRYARYVDVLVAPGAEPTHWVIPQIFVTRLDPARDGHHVDGAGCSSLTPFADEPAPFLHIHQWDRSSPACIVKVPAEHVARVDGLAVDGRLDVGAKLRAEVLPTPYQDPSRPGRYVASIEVLYGELTLYEAPPKDAPPGTARRVITTVPIAASP